MLPRSDRIEAQLWLRDFHGRTFRTIPGCRQTDCTVVEFCLCTTQVCQPPVLNTLSFPCCSSYDWRSSVAVVKIATTTLCRWFLKLITSALIDRPQSTDLRCYLEPVLWQILRLSSDCCQPSSVCSATGWHVLPYLYSEFGIQSFRSTDQ